MMPMSFANNQATQPQRSMPKLVTSVPTVFDAKALPRGVAVGDQHGGCSFTDNVAAVLESRSLTGWQDIGIGSDRWTVIVIDR